MRGQPDTALPLGFEVAEIMEAKLEPRRGRLLALLPTVMQRISLLHNVAPFLIAADDLQHDCTGDECEPCVFRDLIHMWDVRTAPLDRLKQARKLELSTVDRSTCPYCSIDTPSTFDHYLPKSSYPEYAVAAANLIWSCAICNNKKLEMNPLGNDRFLHPGHDPVDSPLLTCTIVDTDGKISAHLAVLTDTAEVLALVDVVEWHVEKLDLAERFRQVAAPELASFLYELESQGVPLSPDVAQVAFRRADGYRHTYGPNRWSVLLFQALGEWLLSR